MVLIFLSLGIVAILSFVFLVIDYAYYTSRRAALQGVADNLALVAAGTLNGSFDGWSRAKQANFLSILQHTKVPGAKESLSDITFGPYVQGDSTCDAFESLASAQPPEDMFEEGDSENFASNVARKGNLEFSIARGVYWYDSTKSQSSGTTQYSFASLESSVCSPSPVYKYLHLGVPIFAVANAVKVEVRMTGLVPFVSGFFFSGSSWDVKVSALATVGSNEPTTVAPIALPACEFLRGIRWPSNLYADGQFERQDQCQRDYVVHDSKWNQSDRYDGIVRASYYPKPPVFEPAGEPELASASVRGVFGIPSGYGRSIILADQMAQYLGNYVEPPDGFPGFQAVLGENFSPLEESPPGLSNILSNTNLRNRLATWITGSAADASGIASSQTFTEAFEKLPLDADNTYNFPTAYPYLRRYYGSFSAESYCANDSDDPATCELRVGIVPFFPTMLAFPMANLRPSMLNPSSWGDQYRPPSNVVGGYRGENVWVNPLCHSQNISRNAALAKARTVSIMLVAPKDGDVQYCKYEQDIFQNSGVSPSIISPILADHEPVVVGIIEGHAIDFNISALTDIPKPLGDRYTIHNTAITDGSDAGVEIDPACDNSAGDMVYENQCGAGYPDPNTLDYYPVTDPSVHPTMCSDFARPFDMDTDWPEKYPLSVAKQGITSGDTNPRFPWEDVQKVCLPALKDPFNCADLDDPACYALKNRAAQFGCSGLRVRVDCKSTSIVSNEYPDPFGRARLVNES